MPTELELIQYEKIASIIFIISSVLSLSSADEAEQAELVELEREQGIEVTNLENSVIASFELGLDSTLANILGSLIFLIVAILRKIQLDEENRTKDTKTSTMPNALIICGLLAIIVGNAITIPAIQQWLKETQEPLIF